MCGIAGIVDLREEVSQSSLEKMGEALRHRGPDHLGIKRFYNTGVGLCHTRLSFLDLSEKGQQPMSDKTQKFWLTFNGEIYNYRALQKELESDYSFVSKTDTEVILAAYAKWGIQCVDKLDGMFAFALYDTEKQKLFLIRDRFGVKPLYYSLQNKRLLFASELKAFESLPFWEKTIEGSALCDYLVYRYIPSPKTCWKNTFKVPPAHLVEVDVHSLRTTVKPYWEVPLVGESYNKKEWMEEVHHLLSQETRKNLHADVPIGAFLSGGYDSSSLCVLAKKNGLSPTTFSLGFADWEQSEHRYAKQVAKSLNLPHMHTLLSPKDLSLANALSEVYDEPLADISTVPTYTLAKFASQEVKGVISGEGADELFVGYHWQTSYSPSKGFSSWLGGKQEKRLQHYQQAMAMGAFTKEELKKLLHSDWHSEIPDDPLWFYRQFLRKDLSDLKQFQYLDLKTFLAELVLPKVDRAAMANSLEVRVPFLNRTLVEKVFQSPEEYYYQPHQHKSVLYQLLKEMVPQPILNRKKQGFVGPDKYYMDSTFYRQQFHKSKLVNNGVVNPSFLTQLIEQPYDWRKWKLMVLEKWYAQKVKA